MSLTFLFGLWKLLKEREKNLNHYSDHGSNQFSVDPQIIMAEHIPERRALGPLDLRRYRTAS